MAANQQLTPQDLQKLIDLYERIDGLSSSAARSAATNAQNLGNAANELQRLERAARDLYGVFGNIVNELKNGTEELQFQETLMSKASSIARQTLEIKKGEVFVDASKVKQLQRENQLLLDNLKLIREKKVAAGENTTEIDKEIAGLNDVGGELNNILGRNKELNKGLVGLAPSLAKIFPNSKLLGESLTSAYQTTMQLGQGAKAAGVGFNAMGTFAKAFGTQLRAALGPIGILIIIVEQIKEAVKAADAATGQLAKDFNITYNEANKTRQQFVEIAEASGDVAVTTKGIQESMTAVAKSLGSSAFLSKENAIFMTQMREKAGFANEELVEMTKYTLATGGNLRENTKNLMFAAKTTALNNGVLLNEREIFNDIAKTSNAVKLSIQGGAAGLGRAAAQAKSLGMTLDQVNNIAGSLMDFESSINAELEAQLLTGKNINLEQARLYAINNDMEGLSREIAKNIGSAADFSKMNRLQQEAVAKAVGMNREELAKTLTDAEALKGLTGDQAKQAQAALDSARARGMTEAQIAETGIKDLMKQQSVQDRFNQSIEKMKEIFVSLAGPILDILSPLADLANVVLPLITGLLKPILGMFSSIAHIVGAIVKTLTGDFTGALESLEAAGDSFKKSITGSIQFKAADKITGGALSETVGVEDAVIKPDGGLVVAGKKGTYSLDKNDSVIAGTKLLDKKSTEMTGEEKAYSVELNTIIGILKEIEFATKSTPSALLGQFGRVGYKGVSGFVDGLGTYLNMNSYKTQ